MIYIAVKENKVIKAGDVKWVYMVHQQVKGSKMYLACGSNSLQDERLDSLLDKLKSEHQFEQSREGYARDFYVHFRRVDLSDLLKAGSIVRLKSGSVCKVTFLEYNTDFLYVISGRYDKTETPISWTAEGFYYNKINPSVRDIVEVLEW